MRGTWRGSTDIAGTGPAQDADRAGIGPSVCLLDEQQHEESGDFRKSNEDAQAILGSAPLRGIQHFRCPLPLSRDRRRAFTCAQTEDWPSIPSKEAPGSRSKESRLISGIQLRLSALASPSPRNNKPIGCRAAEEPLAAGVGGGRCTVRIRTCVMPSEALARGVSSCAYCAPGWMIRVVSSEEAWMIDRALHPAIGATYGELPALCVSACSIEYSSSDHNISVSCMKDATPRHHQQRHHHQ
jgi:hypothetical protein